MKIVQKLIPNPQMLDAPNFAIHKTLKLKKTLPTYYFYYFIFLKFSFSIKNLIVIMIFLFKILYKGVHRKS